ncbi:hypothetical protein RHMOL_Rhmol08G0058800 [Rhododendron molle]|uniref:Uncharacterized protein n=1 Tax=Rhododendron molle TaxID=49168 RepID=A0ACC0MKC6_RHOML|nr:hypothetical protein RHMOL_Rhmol08G0058800 [Rhododendron molle]
MFKSYKQLESADLVGCGGIKAEAIELFVLNCVELRQTRIKESKLSDVSQDVGIEEVRRGLMNDSEGGGEQKKGHFMVSLGIK